MNCQDMGLKEGEEGLGEGGMGGGGEEVVGSVGLDLTNDVEVGIAGRGQSHPT